jgi:NAD(P)-dependent dehydrogenase (short-subunit alcohol dehydrogenase family)
MSIYPEDRPRRLAGKVAIITGTGSGQGRAAAALFAREGARVVGCDANADGAAETLRTVVDAGGEMVSLHPCDLKDAERASELVQLAVDSFGGPDVVYNNAGGGRFAWIEEMTFDDFRGTLENEVHLIFHVTKAAWPHLLARGGGAIVNTASVSGSRAYRALAGLAHSAGKGAVISMTRQMAMEGGPHGIRANSVSPGLVEVPKTRVLLEDESFRRTMLDKLMLPRWGQPEDIASAALFLASDEASWITGIDLRVDGGTTAW